MGAGGAALGVYRAVAHTGEKPRAHRPGHGVPGVGGDGGQVGKGGQVAPGGGGIAHGPGVAVQDGGKLLPGEQPAGPELARLIAVDNALLGGPAHGVGVVLSQGHVGEGGGLGRGRTGQAVEHGDDHRPGGGCVGGKGIAADAVHHALVVDVLDLGVKPVCLRHIGEGQLGLRLRFGGGGRRRGGTAAGGAAAGAAGGLAGDGDGLSLRDGLQVAVQKGQGGGVGRREGSGESQRPQVQTAVFVQRGLVGEVDGHQGLVLPGGAAAGRRVGGGRNGGESGGGAHALHRQLQLNAVDALLTQVLELEAQGGAALGVGQLGSGDCPGGEQERTQQGEAQGQGGETAVSGHGKALLVISPG